MIAEDVDEQGVDCLGKKADGRPDHHDAVRLPILR